MTCREMSSSGVGIGGGHILLITTLIREVQPQEVAELRAVDAGNTTPDSVDVLIVGMLLTLRHTISTILSGFCVQGLNKERSDLLLMSDLYFGEDDGVRYAYLNCPLGCTHQ